MRASWSERVGALLLIRIRLTRYVFRIDVPAKENDDKSTHAHASAHDPTPTHKQSYDHNYSHLPLRTFLPPATRPPHTPHSGWLPT